MANRPFDESRLVKPHEWDVDDDDIMEQFEARMNQEFQAAKAQVVSDRAGADSSSSAPAPAPAASPGATAAPSIQLAAQGPATLEPKAPAQDTCVAAQSAQTASAPTAVREPRDQSG